MESVHPRGDSFGGQGVIQLQNILTN